MAIIDLGKVGITPHGEWAASKPYEELSLVTRNGRAYLSIRDTTGNDPELESSSEDWMLITERGESLYQMMVRTGRFDGTEDEFLQAYEDSLEACRLVTEAAREALKAVDVTMQKVSDDVTNKLVEMNNKMSEVDEHIKGYDTKEEEREAAETERVQNEARRDEQMTQLVNDAQTAINMAGTAQQATEDALREISSKESEILTAEEQRIIKERERKENEEQRISTFNTFQSKIDSKQDTISDLETIREGAALGKTALQKHQDISGLATKEEVAGKQDTISDLDTIREGASKGATALQDYTESDPIYIADKPKLALKSEIPDISGKADKTTIVTETEGNASYAILPNVLTKLGTLASAVTLSLDISKEESGVANIYDIIFTTPTNAPSITWPEGISWVGGSAPAIAGGKTYEVSIMDNLATYGEF